VELKDLKELIELVAAKNFAEFELRKGELTLHIVANGNTTPTVVVTPSPVVTLPVTNPAPVEAPEAPTLPAALPVTAAAPPAEHIYKVKAPIVGTFYRSPSPTAPPFVKVGDNVQVGSVLCIIEAMKLMNEIESEVTGRIAEIYVENGQPVEYGQPLFGIILEQ
jgi:acetyl-CoA carboxylase biotin carboxyl carrier protein